MTDKPVTVTQADKDAAARLNGYASWAIWLTVPQHSEDWMNLCAKDFAAHRTAALNDVAEMLAATQSAGVVTLAKHNTSNSEAGRDGQAIEITEEMIEVAGMELLLYDDDSDRFMVAESILRAGLRLSNSHQN